MINLSKPPAAIQLGVTGENDFRAIEFDVAAWLASRPGGTVSIIYARPDGELYPVAVGVSASPARWTVSDADVAVAGYGSVELRLIDGDVIGKSCTMRTETLKGLGATGDPPAPPAPDWTVTVAENAAAAAESAEVAEDAEAGARLAQNKAEAAVGKTSYIGENGHWWEWDAETGAFVDSGIAATGPQGGDGYTPQRGTDYWTDADIAAMQGYIDTQIGVVENGAY